MRPLLRRYGALFADLLAFNWCLISVKRQCRPLPIQSMDAHQSWSKTIFRITIHLIGALLWLFASTHYVLKPISITIKLPAIFSHAPPTLCLCSRGATFGWCSLPLILRQRFDLVREANSTLPCISKMRRRWCTLRQHTGTGPCSFRPSQSSWLTRQSIAESYHSGTVSVCAVPLRVSWLPMWCEMDKEERYKSQWQCGYYLSTYKMKLIRYI